MQKNAEKMDLSSRNRLLRVPAGSHGFWAHDPLPDPSHDPDVDPRRVTIPLAFTKRMHVPHQSCVSIGLVGVLSVHRSNGGLVRREIL